jgi:hypothetical protein
MHTITSIDTDTCALLKDLEEGVVGHPVDCKLMVYHIHLVEGQNKWQLGLVQNAACIQHV